jgi:hypothetical protein
LPGFLFISNENPYICVIHSKSCQKWKITVPIA